MNFAHCSKWLITSPPASACEALNAGKGLFCRKRWRLVVPPAFSKSAFLRSPIACLFATTSRLSIATICCLPWTRSLPTGQVHLSRHRNPSFPRTGKKGLPALLFPLAIRPFLPQVFNRFLIVKRAWPRLRRGLNSLVKGMLNIDVLEAASLAQQSIKDNVLLGDEECTIDASLLRTGDMLMVRRGCYIPADGVVSIPHRSAR